LENLEDIGDINRAWDNIRGNIKISAQESLGYCESKHRKLGSDDECSKLADQRKLAKLQWLQDPSEAKEDNLSDVRLEASRHFRKKKRGDLKDKINELESNSKNKNIRDLYREIYEFKKGYQPRTNLVKEERGELLVDSNKILNSGRITSVSCRTYTGWVVLGRLKCIQPSHLCQNPEPQRLRLLLGS
jgi:hypothetical protein